MPRRPNPVPSYRLHKPSGQAVVTLRGPDGARRDVYLGVYNSPASRAEYGRIVAELAVSPTGGSSGAVPAGRFDLTVNEILVRFWRHAEEHYRRPDGTTTSELVEYRYALRVLRELYGHTPAREFGPLGLKAVRQKMVELDWCRTTINSRVRRIKHVFKWATGEELIPPGVHQALACVQGLQKGRTTVREPEPVGPVADEVVDATLPYLLPPVRAMVRVQRLTGMRPGEVCRLRPCDLDTTGPVWVYRPEEHKTRHRDKVRAVPIGPKAQAALAEFTPADPTAYYFSPRRAVEAQLAARAEKRLTPRWRSHMARNEKKRKSTRKRSPADRYSPASYARAISRGVDRANRARRAEAEKTGIAPATIPQWAPNQLRHAHATEVRRRFGLEAAQVALGHERADITQVYAERNLTLAAKVAAELG